jgi:hypothetical protein
VAIDNNISEREMKRVVLNRKNSLFVGNPRGGRTAAVLASLTSTLSSHPTCGWYSAVVFEIICRRYFVVICRKHLILPALTHPEKLGLAPTGKICKS